MHVTLTEMVPTVAVAAGRNKLIRPTIAVPTSTFPDIPPRSAHAADRDRPGALGEGVWVSNGFGMGFSLPRASRGGGRGRVGPPTATAGLAGRAGHPHAPRRAGTRHARHTIHSILSPAAFSAAAGRVRRMTRMRGDMLRPVAALGGLAP